MTNQTPVPQMRHDSDGTSWARLSNNDPWVRIGSFQAKALERLDPQNNRGWMGGGGGRITPVGGWMTWQGPCTPPEPVVTKSPADAVLAMIDEYGSGNKLIEPDKCRTCGGHMRPSGKWGSAKTGEVVYECRKNACTRIVFNPSIDKDKYRCFLIFKETSEQVAREPSVFIKDHFHLLKGLRSERRGNYIMLFRWAVLARRHAFVSAVKAMASPQEPQQKTFTYHFLDSEVGL